MHQLGNSEETPKVLEYVTLTDEQVAALVQAQGQVDQAQAVANELAARRDALLVGILTGAHITAGRALRITDEKPARLEVELSANGNGKG